QASRRRSARSRRAAENRAVHPRLHGEPTDRRRVGLVGRGYGPGFERGTLGLSRGEIWWANLPRPWGRRPVLLLARDEAYDMLNWIIAAPLTSRFFAVPTQIVLDPMADHVPRESAVSIDNMQS